MLYSYDENSGRWTEMKKLVLISFFLAVFLSFLLSLFPIQSYDVWWHLRTGELILEELRIPDSDPFTYTASGRHWVTHEWLAEVFFHGLHRLGGLNGLVLFKSIVAALALALGAAAGSIGHRPGERH